MDNPKCTGNCRLCSDLGLCPPDIIKCADCDKELKQGEEQHIEIRTGDWKWSVTQMITVCEECETKYYQ